MQSMRQLIPFFIFCFFTTDVFSNNRLEGRIVSAKSSRAIPYARVDLYREYCIYADKSGKIDFDFNAQVPAPDSITISAVGHISKRFSMRDAANISIFALDIDAGLSENKEPHSFSFKQETARKPLEWLTTGWGTGTADEVAQGYSIEQEKAQLKTFRFGVQYTRKNRILEVKVYTADPVTGFPLKAINTEPIIAQTKGNTTIEVDLEPYNIILPKGAFFISLSWLNLPQNIETVKVDAGKRDQYYPLIDLLDANGIFVTDSKPGELFLKRSGDVWKPFPVQKPMKLNTNLIYKY